MCSVTNLVANSDLACITFFQMQSAVLTTSCEIAAGAVSVHCKPGDIAPQRSRGRIQASDSAGSPSGLVVKLWVNEAGSQPSASVSACDHRRWNS